MAEDTRFSLLEPRDFRRQEAQGADDGDRALRSAAAYELARRDLERRYVEGLLAAGHGNVTAAAKVAGLSRARMYQLVKQHFPELLAAPQRKR